MHQRAEVADRGRDRQRAGAVALGVAIAVVLSMWHSRPPRALGLEAPPGEFSAGRAMAMLAELATEPRPTGSAAGERAAVWVRERMVDLGLEVEVQDTVGLASWGPVAARVRNVIGTLPGTDSSGTVLLVAHHDSVPNSPGASDDGAGVVALLETARVLRQAEPLRNDVAFLVTDAEELGLLGAEAFAAEHSLMRRVRVVMNFEGRGRGGPVTMFETGPESGMLIRSLAGAAPHPIADSLSYEIYRRMPNDTDFSVFKRAGVPGLNFAFINGFAWYHAAIDDVSAIDPATVQHHGSYAVSMARALGDLDLSATIERPDRVYFSLPVLGLVNYPVSWAWPLALGTTILFAGLLIAAARDGRLGAGGTAIGFVIMVAAAVAGCVAAWAATALLIGWNPQSRWMIPAHPYNAGSAVLAVLLAAVLGVIAVYALFGRRRPVLELWTPVLAVWAALLLLVAAEAPGASYLLQWPLLLGLIAFDVRRREGDGGNADGVGLALALPAVLMLATLPPFVVEALGLPLAVIGAAIVVMLALLLIPQLIVTLRPSRLWAPAAVAVAVFVAGTWHLAGAGWSERQPRPDSLLYLYDADADRAMWLSYDPEPDEWTEQFLGGDPERRSVEGYGLWSGRPAMVAEAPDFGIEPPSIEVVATERLTDGGHRLALRVHGRSTSAAVSVYGVDDARVASLRIEGRESALRGALLLRFTAPPAEGVMLTLDVESLPVTLIVVDTGFGLPVLPGTRARPADVIPRRSSRTDLTIVRTELRIAPPAAPSPDVH